LNEIFVINICPILKYYRAMGEGKLCLEQGNTAQSTSSKTVCLYLRVDARHRIYFNKSRLLDWSWVPADMAATITGPRTRGLPYVEVF
jgi:hypothetical protein